MSNHRRESFGGPRAAYDLDPLRPSQWIATIRYKTQDTSNLVEVQADEIKTIVGNKEQPMWIFAVIDVWSQLWPSAVVGKRSYQNALSLFRDLSKRMNLKQVPLVVTDGSNSVNRTSFDPTKNNTLGPVGL